MRLSRYFLPVLKEPPAEAEIVSHKLMLRAGMVQQVSAGIYDWLPLGLRVLKKVERIVREAPAWLARPGVLVVELAPHQAATAVALALDAGFPSAESRRDLTGRDRMLVARLP